MAIHGEQGFNFAGVGTVVTNQLVRWGTPLPPGLLES